MRTAIFKIKKTSSNGVSFFENTFDNYEEAETFVKQSKAIGELEIKKIWVLSEEVTESSEQPTEEVTESEEQVQPSNE